jgi:hypothetical protein
MIIMIEPSRKGWFIKEQGAWRRSGRRREEAPKAQAMVWAMSLGYMAPTVPAPSPIELPVANPSNSNARRLLKYLFLPVIRFWTCIQ